MAAETSADAKVPVALALAKLGVIFAVKNWESITAFTLSPDRQAMLELYWDLYLLTMLVGILGILLFIRRPRLRRTPPGAPDQRGDPPAEAAQ
jgi:SEL1 protein